MKKHNYDFYFQADLGDDISNDIMQSILSSNVAPGRAGAQGAPNAGQPGNLDGALTWL